jgi:hypothetical protein
MNEKDQNFIKESGDAIEEWVSEDLSGFPRAYDKFFLYDGPEEEYSPSKAIRTAMRELYEKLLTELLEGKMGN